MYIIIVVVTHSRLLPASPASGIWSSAETPSRRRWRQACFGNFPPRPFVAGCGVVSPPSVDNCRSLTASALFPALRRRRLLSSSLLTTLTTCILTTRRWFRATRCPPPMLCNYWVGLPLPVDYNRRTGPVPRPETAKWNSTATRCRVDSATNYYYCWWWWW